MDGHGTLLLICVWLLVAVGTKAILITNVGSSLRRVTIGDISVIEWSVRAGDGRSDVTHGHLIFRHDATILADLNLETRTKSNVTEDAHVQWHSSGIGLYGYNISSVRVTDAGVYSCAYMEYLGIPETAPSEITVFVYALPNKPVVTPQTPIMKSTDVAFSCATQSQSAPEHLRPSMDITWFRNNGKLVSSSRYVVHVRNGTMTIRNIDDREKGVPYHCVARESQSPISARSDEFRVVLITITDMDGSQISGIEPGSDVDFRWTVLGTDGPPSEYNHSLVFSRNDGEWERLAVLDLRYRRFLPESMVQHKIIYISPGAGSYGFRLFNAQAEDIGEYTCAYTDEFGTFVTSEPVKLSLKGHTFPVFTTTTQSTTTTSRPGNPSSKHVDEPVVLPSVESTKSPLTDPAVLKSMPLVLALGVGFGCIVLVLVIILPIVLCRKKTEKVPQNILRPNSSVSRHEEGGQCGFDDGGSRYSVYNTLRESMMVTEDMVRAGPCLPDRDGTYNQPFESNRRTSSPRGPPCLRSQSIDGGGDVCRPLLNDDARVATRRHVNRSLSERPEVEENAYLTPISLKPGTTVKYCNAEGSDMSLGGRGYSAEGEAPTAGQVGIEPGSEENGYLTMGKDTEQNLVGIDNIPIGGPYVLMSKEDVGEADQGDGEEDTEYVNVVPQPVAVVDMA